MIRNRSLPCPRSLVAGAALAAALTAGCNPSTTPPPTDPASQTPTFGAADLAPGMHVQVAKQGSWYPAVVVQPMGEGRALIHYDNTGNEWNEVVGPDRLKTMGPGEPGAGPAAHDYRPGERVLVTYKGRLLVADVVQQASPETWQIHYDGFGPEAAEFVGRDRLRQPHSGPTGHNTGETVTVDVNGQQLAAKILAASSADHWVVRFEAFGPQYDQEVGIERIRAGVAVVTPPPPAPVTPPAPPEPSKPEKAAAAPKAAPPAPAPKAPPAPVDIAPSVPTGPAAVGEEVLVSLRGAWFPGSVTAVGTGTYKIKYPSGAEEELPADRILRPPSTTKGLHYQPTQLVVVDYKGVFVPGKIIRQDGKSDYRIRFDGQGPEGDEVVPSRRIRPR